MGDPALDNALRLRRAGRLAEAEEAYNQILRTNPRHFEALHALGILRYQSGHIDEAERLIGAAIAIEPRAADAIYNRACLLLKLGRMDDAIACFGEAISVRPGYVEALTNRGGALMQLERYAEAKADFDTVVVRAPAFAQAWNNRGSAATKLRLYAEALESFRRAQGIPELAILKGDHFPFAEPEPLLDGLMNEWLTRNLPLHRSTAGRGRTSSPCAKRPTTKTSRGSSRTSPRPAISWRETNAAR